MPRSTRSKWAAPVNDGEGDQVDAIIRNLRAEQNDGDITDSSGADEGSGDEYQDDDVDDPSAGQDRGRDDDVFK